MTVQEGNVVVNGTKEKLLIKEIILTHGADVRQIDSELLLHLVESTLCCATSNDFEVIYDAVGFDEIDLIGSGEPISQVIYNISNQILCLCFEDEDLHSKTMALLEMLRCYRWDAKVVLALASFAHIFGLFWLIFHLQTDSAMGFLLARVKSLPKATDKLIPMFKAMTSLIKTMMNVTEVIVAFETLSSQHEVMDDRALDITKSKIYLATYWIFRSIIDCSSRIVDWKKSSRLEQVHVLFLSSRNADEIAIAAYSIQSLRMTLNSLCSDLERFLKMLREQIDTMLYQNLLNMTQQKNIDNQKVLQTMFSSEHMFPLIRNSSLRNKCGISELKNKTVILLISKPELLPMDKIFSLARWSYNHPHHMKFDGRYEILWVPISSSLNWNLNEKRSFEILSYWLPWFSMRWPSSLNPTIVRFIEQEWKFQKDPIMVVLDENGMVTNTNAMDMVWIWGPKAFPFSSSREKELWQKEIYTLINLLIDGFSPLLTQWVEECRNICIFGSENLEWIREFSSTMKTIKSAGIQIEVIYVGCRNYSCKKLKTIIDAIDEENLCTSLSFTKVQFFWFRLEIIRRSMASSDNNSNELGELLDLKECEKGWVMIGKGSSRDVIKFQDEKFKEFLESFPIWLKNVEALGLVGAIRSAFQPPVAGGTCQHVELLPYEEGLLEKRMVCSLCGRSMEKSILYKCEA